MIEILQRTERKAFVIWLRTGRWLRAASPVPAERKFNHNHDPANGQFTGGGGSGGGGGGASASRNSNGGAPSAIGQLFGGGGSQGSWNAPASGRTLPSATATATATGTRIVAAPTVNPAPALRPAPAASSKLRHVVRNGYDFTIDAEDNVRNVSGTITLGNQPRSQRAQREAGGADRLPTDEGGHYIARRFNGPADAFNHFAQDANFNRGGYRVMEKKLNDAAALNKKVVINITPLFKGKSKRPSSLDVLFNIDGKEDRKVFQNAHQGKRHGHH